jgi:hypothetical protein
MNKVKLAALLLVSFVATASVVYQTRNRAPMRGKVVGSAPEPNVSAPAPPPPAAQIIAPTAGGVSKPDQGKGPAPNIPQSGWGRNPFLTVDEIAKLNQPEAPVAVETPQPRPQPPAPPALQAFVVTGIISGNQGNWAIIDGRVMRPGERIGSETVKEVKPGGVVLEHDGRTRELPLKRLEDTAAAAPPKKEINQ